MEKNTTKWNCEIIPVSVHVKLYDK